VNDYTEERGVRGTRDHEDGAEVSWVSSADFSSAERVSRMRLKPEKTPSWLVDLHRNQH
jgi:hypothetical protein